MACEFSQVKGLERGKDSEARQAVLRSLAAAHQLWDLWQVTQPPCACVSQDLGRHLPPRD